LLGQIATTSAVEPAGILSNNRGCLEQTCCSGFQPTLTCGGTSSKQNLNQHPFPLVFLRNLDPYHLHLCRMECMVQILEIQYITTLPLVVLRERHSAIEERVSFGSGSNRLDGNGTYRLPLNPCCMDRMEFHCSVNQGIVQCHLA